MNQMLSSDGYYGERKRLDHHGKVKKITIDLIINKYNSQDLICFLSMYLTNRTLIKS